MKTQVRILGALIFSLTGCTSSIVRGPASTNPTQPLPKAAAPHVAGVVAFNPETGKGCLLNQDKYNFYGPALNGNIMVPNAHSRKLLSQVPECSAKVNAQYQNLASVSYPDGPKMAGIPVAVGYYLICSAILGSSARLDTMNQENLSDTRKTVQNWVWGLGIAASWTACIPATVVNISLLYVYTDIDFSHSDRKN